MPVPRREDPGRIGDSRTGFGSIPAAPVPQARPITDTEAQRRYRAGIRVGRGSAGNGRPSQVWGQPRNGLPVKLYRYHGTGADAFTGEVVEL